MRRISCLFLACFLFVACQSAETSEHLLPSSRVQSDDILSSETNSNIANSSIDNSVGSGISAVYWQKGSESERVYYVQFSFPEGFYFEGGNIYQTVDGMVPDTIYKYDENEMGVPSSNKIGAVSINELEIVEDSEEQLVINVIDDNIVPDDVDPFSSHTYSYSTAENLPSWSYYYYGGRLVATNETGIAVSGINMKQTHFICALDDKLYLDIWFYHNLDSVGAKTFFENLVSGISVK